MDIYKLMDMAGKELNKRFTDLDSIESPANEIYTDDWQWNDTAFQFSVFGLSGEHNQYTENLGTFRFCYDAEDVFERSAEEQLMDWLDELF